MLLHELALQLLPLAMATAAANFEFRPEVLLLDNLRDGLCSRLHVTLG